MCIYRVIVIGGYMCSTPRPRRKVNTKSVPSGTILSNMSANARSRFAQRANMAQERRDQIAIKTRQTKNQITSDQRSTKKVANTIIHKSPHSFSYWLLNASLKEVFVMIFFGHSKRV